jgi:hypothetical protein
MYEFPLAPIIGLDLSSIMLVIHVRVALLETRVQGFRSLEAR